jgi:hypothetical protein
MGWIEEDRGVCGRARIRSFVEGSRCGNRGSVVSGVIMGADMSQAVTFDWLYVDATPYQSHLATVQLLTSSLLRTERTVHAHNVACTLRGWGLLLLLLL